MKVIISIIALLIPFISFSQKDKLDHITIDGEIMSILITSEGDTLYIDDLDEVIVKSPRCFANSEDEKLYRRYRRYAIKVYPYATQAIQIFTEMQEDVEGMSRRKRKKHIKKLQKRLEKEFKEPLKHLSKTQGKILVKMIEKELDTPFYSLLKDLRGGFTATYWSTFGRMYGYRLKEGYIIGDNPILDLVIDDFDISYKLK